MKKVFSVLMTMITVVVFIMNTNVYANSKAHDEQNFTKAYQIFWMVGKGDPVTGNGPISITQGKLNDNGIEKDVYIVTMYGMVTNGKSANDFSAAVKASSNSDNAYLRKVLEVIKKNVPEDSNLLLAGASLGGMVAQQVASDSTIKKSYKVINTITFGSPYINGTKEGTLSRLADKSDIIPFLVTSFNLSARNKNINIEDGGYKGDFKKVHGWSYAREDVWGEYDVLGVKGGNAKITVYQETTEFYEANK